LSLFYRNHKASILFNRNLIIAATCSAILSSVFSDLYFNIQSENANYKDASNRDLTNSVLTLAIEYSIDTPIFAFLYYRDNRHLYLDSLTGKKDTSKIKSDIKKLFAVFSVTDVMYIVVRIAAQYQLMQQTGLEPFETSIISSVVAWLSFFILVNITMNVFDRFKRDEFFWFCTLVLSMNITNSLILFSGDQARVFYTNATADITAGIALLSVLFLVYKLGKQKWKLKELPLSSSLSSTNKAFLFLAIAIALWFTAELLWTYYQLGLGIEVPFPSLADIFWLIGYVFLTLHLYKILTVLKNRIKLIKIKYLIIISVILAIIFGCTLSLVYGFTDLSTFFILSNTEALGNIVLLSYPVLDAILIVPAVAILWSLRRGERQFVHWILIASFIVMVTIGDAGFGYSNALGQETAEKEEWIWDTFFNAGYLSIAAALFWYSKFLVEKNDLDSSV
jgi:hypothetical protein